MPFGIPRPACCQINAKCAFWHLAGFQPRLDSLSLTKSGGQGLPPTRDNLVIMCLSLHLWVERSETQQFNRLDSPKELGFTYFFRNVDLKWVNNLSLEAVFIVHFRSTPPNAPMAFGVDSLRDLSNSRYVNGLSLLQFFVAIHLIFCNNSIRNEKV